MASVLVLIDSEAQEQHCFFDVKFRDLSRCGGEASVYELGAVDFHCWC